MKLKFNTIKIGSFIVFPYSNRGVYKVVHIDNSFNREDDSNVIHCKNVFTGLIRCFGWFDNPRALDEKEIAEVIKRKLSG